MIDFNLSFELKKHMYNQGKKQTLEHLNKYKLI